MNKMDAMVVCLISGLTLMLMGCGKTVRLVQPVPLAKPTEEPKPEKVVVGTTVIGIAPDACTGKGTYSAKELAEVGTKAFNARDWAKAAACYGLFVESYAKHKDYGVAV